MQRRRHVDDLAFRHHPAISIPPITVKSTSHSEGGPSVVPRDVTTTIEAKWLGACKPDQKPGDIVMPGGFKLNIKDADKLKGLLPK